MKIGFADAVRLAVAFEFIVSILMAYSYRRELHLADAAWLQICAIIGAALGVVLKSRIDSRVVLASSMVTIILLCLAFLKRISFRVAPSPVKTLMAGGLSGLLNTWSSLSGPPVVLYLLATQASAVSIKGRLSSFFLMLYGVTISLFIWRGEYTHFHYWTFLLVGSALILIAYPVANRLTLTDLVAIRRGALAFIVVSAVVVLARAFSRT